MCLKEAKAGKPSITFTGCHRDKTTILQGELKALLRQGKGSREGGGCLGGTREGRGRDMVLGSSNTDSQHPYSPQKG